MSRFAHNVLNSFHVTSHQKPIYLLVQDEKKSVKKKRKRKKSSARRASDSSEEESDAESKVSHSFTDGSFLFWLMESQSGAENVPHVTWQKLTSVFLFPRRKREDSKKKETKRRLFLFTKPIKCILNHFDHIIY